MRCRAISTVVLGAVLVACGSEPVDLNIDDLAGTWAASWGPLSGGAPGNEWTRNPTHNDLDIVA